MNDKSFVQELKGLWPILTIGTIVVVGIALVGRWQTEGFSGTAGPGINKRKNFLRREDYGYPDVPMVD